MKKFLTAIGLAALPLSALAHVGHHDLAGHAAGAFWAAFAHPFTGVDHMAAMLVVGAWSVLTPGPAWRTPLVFVAMLLAGAAAAFAGLQVPAIEPMIAASVLVLGLLLARRRAVKWAVGAALVGGFAWFHGAAHGQELNHDGLAAVAALAGIAAGSATLHLMGMALGRIGLGERPGLTRISGLATALLGATMLMRLA